MIRTVSGNRAPVGKDNPSQKYEALLLILVAVVILVLTAYHNSKNSVIRPPFSEEYWANPRSQQELRDQSPITAHQNQPSLTPNLIYYDLIQGKVFKIEQFVPFGEKIDLNTASLYSLTILKGVGEATARSIIKYRQDKGPFTHISEILRIPGIGDRTYLKLAPRLMVSSDNPKDD
ncbi:ComEA family DNA-binding protein [candidate division CSSED10-310 bacterium]|uniref:ComEA family DNA-binding protein n=1 Tax=candidate division CSSED10-310 bacterium TaxID=2855610 RepID=A0ABV6YZJ2_UNCC1